MTDQEMDLNAPMDAAYNMEKAQEDKRNKNFDKLLHNIFRKGGMVMTDQEMEKLEKENAVRILDMLSKEISNNKINTQVFLNSLCSVLGMWKDGSCGHCKGGDILSPYRPYEVLCMCNYCAEK